MSCVMSLVLVSFLAVGPGEVTTEPAANLKTDPGLTAEYEGLKAKAGHDAESQVRLALWCEAHGLTQERFRHLAAVVLRDPSNSLARGLMGLVEYRGKWKRPEAVADAMKADVAHADLLAEYNGKRVKTPVTAFEQYKLAVWCDEKGLPDEARAHLATVVRLDPKHSEAWKKLGYKKVGDHWVTDAQAAMDKADHETQLAADRHWKLRLEPLRDHLKGKGTHEETRKALSEISDPRAVPMIVRVFLGNGPSPNPLMAVQLLGQIDAIESSRSLTKLALRSHSPEIRSKSIETLRRRDPREWADLPIQSLRSKIAYTMKPVGGPTDPGVLEIKTNTANYKRIYRPGAEYQIQPGDRIFTDASGQQVVSRITDVFMNTEIPTSVMQQMMMGTSSVGNPMAGTPMNPPFMSGAASPDQSQAMMRNNAALANRLNQGLQYSAIAGQGQKIVAAEQMAAQYVLMQQQMMMYQQRMAATQQRGEFDQWLNSTPTYRGLDRSKPGDYIDLQGFRTVNVPLAQLQRDAVNSVTAAADQLNGDKAILDQVNLEIVKENTRAMTLLSSTTGQTLGDDREAWEKWISNQVGYALMTPTDVPTVVENVSSTYVPQAIATPGFVGSGYRRISCFGKGTPVQTASGPRPIEELKVGDLVLSQDLSTGKLRYRPITVVHHNPPSPTYKVALNDEAVISSYFHRFWKVGQGWVMARDLTTGDTIRVLGGVAKVTAIEDAPVQSVFNLDVADDGDFFAGTMAALVHDNSLPDLKQKPFDAPVDVLATAKK